MQRIERVAPEQRDLVVLDAAAIDMEAQGLEYIALAGRAVAQVRIAQAQRTEAVEQRAQTRIQATLFVMDRNFDGIFEFDRQAEMAEWQI